MKNKVISQEVAKITKSINQTTTGTGNPWINDFTNEDWSKILQQQKVIFPQTGNNIWIPPDQWTWGIDYGEPVKARCFLKNCKKTTDMITELKLGEFVLKTYICKGCLSDLAEKLKNELGIDDEEEK